MNYNDLEQYADLFFEFLDPLIEASNDRAAARTLLNKLGYRSPEDLAAFEQLGSSVAALRLAWDEISALLEGDDEPSTEQYVVTLAGLFDALFSFMSGLAAITDLVASELSNGGLPTNAETAQALLRELFDYLFIELLTRRYPLVQSLLRLAGIIDVTIVGEETALRVPYTRGTVKWDAIGQLLRNPRQLLTETYWPNATHAMRYDHFIFNVQSLALRLGLFAQYDSPNADVAASFNNGDDLSGHAALHNLDVLEFPFMPFIGSDVGCMIYPVIDRGESIVTGAGLGLYFGTEHEIEISDEMTLRLDADGAITDGLGVVWSKDGNFDLRHRIFSQDPASALEGTDGRFTASWIYPRSREIKTAMRETQRATSRAKMTILIWLLPPHCRAPALPCESGA